MHLSNQSENESKMFIYFLDSRKFFKDLYSDNLFPKELGHMQQREDFQLDDNDF